MNGFDAEVPTDEDFPYGEGYDEEGYVIRPNKSQLRRDAMALLDLGKKLSEFDANQLQRMNLSDELLDALMAAKKIHQNGARKRHFKFVAKILRKMDTEALEQAVADVTYVNEKNNAMFHHIEHWRNRLLDVEDKDALTAWMSEHPQSDVGHLRQLMRNANKEAQQQKPPRASRMLFQALRDIIQTEKIAD